MGDPFKCVRCDIWFDYYEALEDHIKTVHPKPSDHSALANLQYELKEAMLEIDRHHKAFKQISEILDAMDPKDLPPGDPWEYAQQALKDIRSIVG